MSMNNRWFQLRSLTSFPPRDGLQRVQRQSLRRTSAQSCKDASGSVATATGGFSLSDIVGAGAISAASNLLFTIIRSVFFLCDCLTLEGYFDSIRSISLMLTIKCGAAFTRVDPLCLVHLRKDKAGGKTHTVISHRSTEVNVVARHAKYRKRRLVLRM